jgi:glycerol-3-phosphate cytidylyltransferase-like family protein
MATHFSMGAINKDTSNYEYAKIASKKNKYKCPSCHKDVIFRNGKIKSPHYAHKKSESQCFYYDKPTESQIHKDAKMLLKSLLDNKQCINVFKRCKYCKPKTIEDFCEGGCDDVEYIDTYYNENTKAIIEYKFNYNNSKRRADVALIEDDKIKYIFEICNKNKTKEENRPEPWVEIKAIELINNVNSYKPDDDEGIDIDCIRDYKCDYCIECEENEKKMYLIEKQKEREREMEMERMEMERERKEREREIEMEMEFERLGCKRTCGISEPCICEIPKYTLVSINNNYFCNRCRNWKCRC